MTGGLLIQVVLWEKLTVVINDKWSLNAGGRLSRFNCIYKMYIYSTFQIHKVG